MFDSQASLTLAFCFTVKPNCKVACDVMNSFGEIISYMPTLFFKICCCLQYYWMFDIFSNELWVPYYGELQSCLCNYYFIIGPISHQIFSQLHHVFGQVILSCFVGMNSSNFPFQTRSILICFALNHCVGYIFCSAFFSPKIRSTDLLQKHNNLWDGQCALWKSQV